MEKKSQPTPLMRQYYDLKNQYQDAILFFQVGDFYEIFAEDAIKASSFLAITLTKKNSAANVEPIPLCGVPIHVADHYIQKLVKGGFKVAICDQVEQPKPGKIVERKVTQVLTPGTLTDSRLLDDKSASYLSIFYPTFDAWYLIFAEILTGQLHITRLKSNSAMSLLESELNRFFPDEIILPNNKFGQGFEKSLKNMGFVVSLEEFQDNFMILEESKNWISTQFINLTELTVEYTLALTLFYKFLKRTNQQALAQFKQIFFYLPEDYLMLDPSTQKNLELVKNLQDNSANNTLYSILDESITPMGSRTIKKWLLRPLVQHGDISKRLDDVSLFIENPSLFEVLRSKLREIGDLERIIGRIALRRGQISDYLNLRKSLESCFGVFAAHMVRQAHHERAAHPDFSPLINFLHTAINDDLARNWLVKSGFNGELDRLRRLVDEGSQAILALEKQEQDATGINSLKIRHNGAYGYGIEVTKPNLHLVPAHYTRTQTLLNRERFTMQALKDLEYDLMRAESDIEEVEKEAFESIRSYVETFIPDLKKLSQNLSYIDATQGLAYVAYKNEYVRPKFNDKREIQIIQGRHPVIEKKKNQNSDTQFVPNDLNLNDTESLWIITGPNMGGKSTFLRQNALICIMAQMGSFVPARSANLFILDRIFTRIGATDNVAEGKSTFLVEMEETALIANYATKNSFVILDEVGRGTSTVDGLAIAQAVVEYLYTRLQSRCLFATHYRELTALKNNFPAIVNYYAASARDDNGIILLHKILKGVADSSFGIEVARLAKLPDEIIERSYQLVCEFSGENKVIFGKNLNQNIQEI